MAGQHPTLRQIHWDILRLIRALCYDGLHQTKSALVDPDDRYIPKWDPLPNGSWFTTPNGVPGPFVDACLLSLTWDDSVKRWDTGSTAPDIALKYLLDRRLIHSSSRNGPVCGAFINPFNHLEVLSTIELCEPADGPSYCWVVSCGGIQVWRCQLSLQNKRLTTTPFAVLQLTDRGHEVLDQGAAVTGKESRNSSALATASDPLPSNDGDRLSNDDAIRIPAHAIKANSQYKEAAKALDTADPTDREAYDKLIAAYEASGEKCDLPPFETWQRYLRKYRRLTSTQKNTPRAQRSRISGSIVPASQIESERIPTGARKARRE